VRAARRLIVSVPGRELQKIRPSSSIFPAEQLPDDGISPALRDALGLVLHHSSEWEQPTLLVARPEIFPGGETLSWLQNRIPGATTHVAISDGSAVKLIPGLKNHVFFYSFGNGIDENVLKTLVRRTSRQLGALRSQWNSAYALRFEGKNVSLPTTALAGYHNPLIPDRPLFKLYLDKGNIAASMETISAIPAIDSARLNSYSQITYVTLTHSLLGAEKFRSVLGKVVLEHFFDDSSALVFALPETDGKMQGVSPSLEAFLTAARDTTFPIPKLAASNIFLSFGELSDAALDVLDVPVMLWLSDDTALWRHPPSYYQKFESIRVYFRPGLMREKQFNEMAAILLGRKFELSPLRFPGSSR